MTRSIRLISLVAAAALLASSAHATLRRPDLPSPLSTGEVHDGSSSELWFSVVDTTQELSYSLDLGVTIAQLRATNADTGNLSGLASTGTNLSAGFQKASDATNDYAFWVIAASNDSAWRSLTTALGNLGNATWAVMGADSLGSASAGQRGFVTTVQQGQEAAYRDFGNGAINQLVGGTLASFVGTGLNSRPSHAVSSDPSGDLESSIAVNGSSLDSKRDNPDAYFGLVLDAFSSASSPLMTNAVGQSAWFYDVTRSGASNLLKANVNEFDNLAGDAYWGFTAEAGDTGRYLLSYVLPRYLSPTEQAAGLTFENNFARLAGVLSVNAGVGQADTVLSLTEGFMRRLVSRQQAQGLVDTADGLKFTQDLGVGQAMALAVSAVPEPGTWGLMALGVLALGWRVRRSGP